MKIVQKRESFVCAGSTPVHLRYPNIVGDVKVYADNGKTTRAYAEGKDYTVAGGMLVRLQNSALPDFTEAPLFGLQKFDHEKFEVWGNAPYMLFADYEAEVPAGETTEAVARAEAVKNGNAGALSAFFASVGQRAELLVFGDSISTGCEATAQARAYFSLFALAVKEHYGVNLCINNKSIGGETTRSAIKRYEQVIGGSDAKLMILAYGMNDQNCFGNTQAVDPQEYHANICTIAKAAEQKGMKVLLVSPCDPHPNWIHTSGRMREYVDVLRTVSQERGYAFADVNTVWKNELRYKRPDDLLNNGINHPTDYGHAIYAEVLKQLL